MVADVEVLDLWTVEVFETRVLVHNCTLISDCAGAIEAASQTAIKVQELAVRNAEIIKVLVNKVY